jgi:hypothetical protein
VVVVVELTGLVKRGVQEVVDLRVWLVELELLLKDLLEVLVFFLVPNTVEAEEVVHLPQEIMELAELGVMEVTELLHQLQAHQ